MTDVVTGDAGRRLPRWKAVAFSLAAGLLSYGLAELAAGAVLLVRFGSVPSVEEISGRSPDAPRPPADAAEPLLAAALHPYVGYVHTPLSTPLTTMAVESLAIGFDDGNAMSVVPGRLSTAARPSANRWGFLGESSPLRRRDPGKVVVGVLGGSVAESFSVEAGDRLASELEKVERFAGKEVEVVTLAVQGFKQPQQLLAVTYLLSLGGEFDVLINVDGFNELFVSVVQNYDRGVYPTFPMLWDRRLEPGGAAVDHLTLGRLAYARHRRAAAAAFFARFPFRSSNIARCVWLGWSTRLSRQQAEILEGAAAVPPPARKSEAVGGPFEAFPDDAALYAYCVDVWRRSSLQLHRLCEGHGVTYYHFLQPNQYVPGSKPMAADELGRAVTAGSPFDRVVRRGYPLLEVAGDGLRQRGVRFASLTDVFGGREEPFYKDNCCHVNRAGSEVMAVEVARFVGERP